MKIKFNAKSLSTWILSEISPNTKQILEALKECQMEQCLIGIWAPSLDGGFITGYVTSIRYGNAENDTVIILKERNLSGESLETRVLHLKEITRVHRFRPPNF